MFDDIFVIMNVDTEEFKYFDEVLCVGIIFIVL